MIYKHKIETSMEWLQATKNVEWDEWKVGPEMVREDGLAYIFFQYGHEGWLPDG